MIVSVIAMVAVITTIIFIRFKILNVAQEKISIR